MESILKKTEEEMANHTAHDSSDFTALLERYNGLLETFEDMDGYAYKSRIRGILFGLGFLEADFSRTVDTLSGGQRSRLNIAKLLLKNPDVLMLDEPTNHLDIESVTWLETYLKQYKGTVIVITHDRFFLDQVCSRIFEIYNHEMFTFEGSYSKYIPHRNEILEYRQSVFEKQQTDIKKQEDLIRRFKQHGTEKLAKRARSREKALEKIDIVEQPTFVNENANIQFSTHIKSGKDVLQVEALSKSFDNQVIFENATFDIYRTERIGLIGPNGVGKTSLFKILTHALSPDEGQFKLGHNVNIGYFDQNQANLHEDLTLFQEIQGTDVPLSDTQI